MKIATQEEFDIALAGGAREFEIDGDVTIVVTSSDEMLLVCNVSQPRVVAWGSSQPRVEARGSSQPRVVAQGYTQLSVTGTVTVTAGPHVAMLVEGNASVTGGQQTRVARSTIDQWCAYYGVRVVDGVATLYKGVSDDYRSPRGGDYAPGSVPVAADWDGGKEECGGGLHFSPTPRMTHEFHQSATKYLACPVRLSDIRAPRDGDSFPNKVKAKGCCGPVIEVDEDGEPIVSTPAAMEV